MDITSVPLQNKCRWFVKRGATTWFNRGFRTMKEADDWIVSHKDRILWRAGFTFKIKGEDEKIEIVKRSGVRA